MSQIERTLVILKPENFGNSLPIFWHLENLLRKTGDFSRTIPFHIYNVPEKIIREHYQNMAHLPAFEPTVKAFSNSEDGLVICVYLGENIIKRVRHNLGHTDPQKAEPWTIRGRFSNDSLESATREIRYLNNVMHASDRDNAEREIELWKDYIDFSFTHL